MANRVERVITGITCTTPVGSSAEMTAASVRAGIGRLEYSDALFNLKVWPPAGPSESRRTLYLERVKTASPMNDGYILGLPGAFAIRYRWSGK